MVSGPGKGRARYLCALLEARESVLCHRAVQPVDQALIPAEIRQTGPGALPTAAA